MDRYKITESDIDSNFFHFTKKVNISNIEKKGLIPKIFLHAKNLEDTKKVFFVEGLDNLLILFDCWIHVVSVYPLIPFGFKFGTKLRGNNIFSKAIIKIYFFWTKIFVLHKFIAYKYFDRFLKKYILLNIDIKENIDFSYDDIDQIKAKKYDKDFLIKGGYSLKYSDLNSYRMDKWNLHTYSNHGVDANKIKLCYIGDSYKMIDILKFAIDNTNLDLKNICPTLWNYLSKRKNIINIYL